MTSLGVIASARHLEHNLYSNNAVIAVAYLIDCNST